MYRVSLFRDVFGFLSVCMSTVYFSPSHLSSHSSVLIAAVSLGPWFNPLLWPFVGSYFSLNVFGLSSLNNIYRSRAPRLCQNLGPDQKSSKKRSTQGEIRKLFWVNSEQTNKIKKIKNFWTILDTPNLLCGRMVNHGNPSAKTLFTALYCCQGG